MLLQIATFAKEIGTYLEAYLLNRAKKNSAILFVFKQFFLKCIALNFLKLHVLLACACSLECDYRAGHIMLPVENLRFKSYSTLTFQLSCYSLPFQIWKLCYPHISTRILMIYYFDELITKLRAVAGFDYQLVHSVTRGSDLKIFLPRSRTNIRKGFPLLRLIKNWNALKPTSSNLLSIAAFSRFLLNTAHQGRSQTFGRGGAKGGAIENIF